ncbi:baseplate wedge subunit [Klebsiella phage KP27]|uniref:Baseplate wedge subunit n=1 Tax=Klebsiella phage KP27 TaxID=1129147 RepID=K7NS04_9CAUD|nr:baseplate wedge subunit [Klebsiella phage KP27]AEX26679.1 baseplate wedge subunit [Klebsiella phage KP27]
MAQQNLYRSVITAKFRTENLMNFKDMIGDAADLNTIYMSIGRTESWSDNESDPNFAPPYPNDSTDGVSDMWTHMIGATKVPGDMIDAILPRKDWGDTRYPNPKIFYFNDIVVVNTAPYNRTDPGKGWMVYRVVDVPDIGSCSISSITGKLECIRIGGIWSPSHESSEPPRGEANGIDMGDGYKWEYLYTIPPDVVINRCTNEHIVVPFPGELEEDPVRWGYDNVIQWYPGQYDLVYRLKVNSMRFRAYMDSLFFPQSTLPGNKGFRQISIIVNPLIKKASPTDPEKKATGDYYNANALEPDSGRMIYMENRQPIIRSLDQTEEVSIVFEF